MQHLLRYRHRRSGCWSGIQGLRGKFLRVFGDNDNLLRAVRREDGEQVGLIELGTDSETLEPPSRLDAFAWTTTDGEPLKAREMGKVVLVDLGWDVPLGLNNAVGKAELFRGEVTEVIFLDHERRDCVGEGVTRFETRKLLDNDRVVVREVFEDVVGRFAEGSGVRLEDVSCFAAVLREKGIP